MSHIDGLDQGPEPDSAAGHPPGTIGICLFARPMGLASGIQEAMEHLSPERSVAPLLLGPNTTCFAC